MNMNCGVGLDCGSRGIPHNQTYIPVPSR